MHKVLADKSDTTRPALRGEGDRDHTLKLIQMLALKMDSISRTELFKQFASEHGMRDYLEIFTDTGKRDQAHIEWLKEQILQSIK